MTTSTRLKHSAGAFAHTVSQQTWRDSFKIKAADAIYYPAIKVGIAGTLVLVIGGLLGQEQLAGIASLGALTSAFGRYQPYGRLARQLSVVGAAMLIAGALGAFMGAWHTPMLAQILVLSVIAALASAIFAALKITGPGPVILVFAAAAGSGYAHSVTGIGEVVLAILIGAATGWLVAMAPVAFNPLGPARLATARAISSVMRAGLPDSTEAARQSASASISTARDSLTLSPGVMSAAPSNGTSQLKQRNYKQAHVLNTLLNECRAVLTLAGTPKFGPAMDQLATHESALRTVTHRPDLEATLTDPQDSHPAALITAPLFPAARATFTSRVNVHQALRMALASALAGWAAVALDLAHPLWAAMGAVATLQGFSYSVTVQRGIQRLAGNVIGALIAAGLLALGLGFWPSVALVVILQLAAEIAVMRNYTLTTMAVTPMALIMTGLGSHIDPSAALSRVEDTLVGVVIGILVAAISVSRHDRHHLSKP